MTPSPLYVEYTVSRVQVYNRVHSKQSTGVLVKSNDAESDRAVLILPQYSSTAVQQYAITALATVQQYSIRAQATVQQYGHIALAKVQQYSSTAVQQYSSTALASHYETLS